MQYKKGYQKLARALANFWICIWVKLVRGNVIMIIVSSSFSKNFVFKNSKTQRQRFQIFPVWRALSKTSSVVTDGLL